MKDIHEVLRQKQAKYAQLGKQIEMLQQAASPESTFGQAYFAGSSPLAVERWNR